MRHLKPFKNNPQSVLQKPQEPRSFDPSIKGDTTLSADLCDQCVVPRQHHNSRVPRGSRSTEEWLRSIGNSSTESDRYLWICSSEGAIAFGDSEMGLVVAEKGEQEDPTDIGLNNASFSYGCASVPQPCIWAVVLD